MKELVIEIGNKYGYEAVFFMACFAFLFGVFAIGSLAYLVQCAYEKINS